MTSARFFGATLSLVLSLASSPAIPKAVSDLQCPAAGLRLNDIQLIGTHNSYHIEPDPAILKLMTQTNYKQSAAWPASRLAPAISYTFPPLDVQLAYGIRHFEIDVFHDPTGKRFSNPGAYVSLAKRRIPSQSTFSQSLQMDAPGFKVMHAADLDVRSTCATLKDCLTLVRAWSDQNPGHMPIVIQIEAKESVSPPIGNDYVPADVLKFDAEAFRALNDEIGKVFPTEKLILPDDVRDGAANLNIAVRTRGWPLLASVRGRVMFTLGDTAATNAYLQAYPGVRGGILFPSKTANDPDTAWLNLYSPDDRTIKQRVEEGFIVYTRADAHGIAARQNNPRDRDLAFASGAHLISTDYPWPDFRWSSYRVTFEDGSFVRARPGAHGPDCN